MVAWVRFSACSYHGSVLSDKRTPCIFCRPATRATQRPCQPWSASARRRLRMAAKQRGIAETAKPPIFARAPRARAGFHARPAKRAGHLLRWAGRETRPSFRPGTPSHPPPLLRIRAPNCRARSPPRTPTDGGADTVRQHAVRVAAARVAVRRACQREPGWASEEARRGAPQRARPSVRASLRLPEASKSAALRLGLRLGRRQCL